MWKIWKKKADEVDEVPKGSVPVVEDSQVFVCELQGWEAAFSGTLSLPPKGKEWRGIEVWITDEDAWLSQPGRMLKFNLANLGIVRDVMRQVEEAAKKIEEANNRN